MNLLRFLRFFLPLENPIGFGASDFMVLGLAALLVLLILLRGRVEAIGERFAQRPLASMLLAGCLPVVLRLALLDAHPVPTPRVADDFSYLLLSDTLSHFRLANPMHPMRRFFEGVFVLHEPSYGSIFPMGQGIALALGNAIFGHPWAGVVLSVAAFCALCCWMLRAWTTPGWALMGGILAGLEFGPLSSWMNSYWGGAVSAIAGCLVFGTLPRLLERSRTRDAVLLGAGLGIQLLSRPFESIPLLIAVMLFLIPAFPNWRTLVKPLAIAALVVTPAIGLTLLQNRQVTGSWTTLPYELSRYQYGIPTTFTFEQLPVPHNQLTVEQQVDYDAQVAVHNRGTYFGRLIERFRFFRFFFLPPLYLMLPAFLLALREYRFAWVALVISVFWLADNFYPYFYPHYVAAAACLFVLIGVKGLELWSRLCIKGIAVGADAARLVLFLCLAHFLFWYGIHSSGNQNLLAAMSEYESWDSIEYGDSDGRIALNRQLDRATGPQLVFVHFSPNHSASEWIHNAADINRAKVVWAIDLGPEEDQKLLNYYPGRKAWLLEPDARPPRLTPY